MEALIGIGVLVILMVAGIPVAFSFAGMTLVLGFLYDVNFNSLMLTGFRSMNSVVLMALPLFILTGYLMQSGGLAERLIEFIESLIGRIRGGLGMSMILAAALFGAISGTASAAVASIGSIMIKPMAERGYSRAYASALLGISSLLGILIPPSITMILFAAVTRQSVAACFAATIGPGILLIIGLCIANYFMFRRQGKLVLPDSGAALLKKQPAMGRSTRRALPAMSMPVIILGGIYGGVFTPTEAAAVSAVAAFIIGFFIYRDMAPKAVFQSVIDAAETTGVILIILLFSLVVGRIFSMERVPQQITEFMLDTFKDPVWILLVVNLFLILAGMIVDDLSVTVIISPLLLPVMQANGVHPVHFAAIVGTSVVIGANSPPTAPILYMACRIGECEIHEAVGTAVRLMSLVALPVALITTYFPELSLFIPRLLGFVQ
ncbi:MAG: TRAP transporter large permease [Desulfobacterales bacterium]|nr:TRAP transporter large permease [Desulfobacterales bacterium]